jgi:deoxycytidylate deaminase
MCGCDLIHLANNAVNKFKHSKCMMLAHHVAFIFTKNNILCASENRLMPNKKNKNNIKLNNNFKHITNETSIHAEMGVLEKFNESSQFKKNGKYNLMVINFNKDLQLRNSRPCFICSNAILQSKKKIKKIYYSTNDGDIISESIYSLLNLDRLHFSIGFVDKIQFILKRLFGPNVEFNMITTKSYELLKKF